MPFVFDSAKTAPAVSTEVPEGTTVSDRGFYSVSELFLNLDPPKAMAISPSCQKMVRHI